MAEQERLPILSIITVTWNHRDEIEEYLEAIESAGKSCRYPIELIIVDNASSDGTAQFVKERLPWAKVIENQSNTGFAVGCNIGLEAAMGDYLLLLNPDAFAEGSALEAMMRFLVKNNRVGAVGCLLRHDDGLPQISAYSEMGPLSYALNQSMLYPVRERLRKFFFRLGIRRRRPYECGWLMASCTLVPRAVYEKVGGLEPSFFMYCEDADWCQRIRVAGHAVIHMPNVSIRHRQKGSTKRAPEYTFRRVYRSVLHYANRQVHGFRREVFQFVMLTDMYLRLPVYRLVGGREERVNSVRQLIAIIKARDPDLFDDPPPRS